MASVKQTKQVMKRIYFHHTQLMRATYQAKALGIVVYENYDSEAPTKSLAEYEEKLDSTTEKVLASAFRREVRGYK